MITQEKVMDWVLVIFSFTKCYINNIVIFNLSPKDHMQHL
jgi:hypothetical protein